MPLIVIGMENNFTSQQEKIAKMLLTMRAFHLQSSTPFTFRNGWKAPFYLDDRKILSYIYSRNLVKIEMAHTILRHFPDADVIAGIAPNAIAFGVLMAQDLGLPFVSVYHTPKKHGLENQIEGDVRPKQKVVLIENQILVGNDTSKAAEALRANGCSVIGVVTLYDYELPSAARRLKNIDVPVQALTTHSALIAAAEELQMFGHADMEALAQWHKSPQNWKKY